MIDSVDDLRPKLRGVLHEVAFFVACAVGIVFIIFTPAGRVAPATVFAVSAALMLGTSALYHRVQWGPRARLWMRRADHAAIFILIAGTYTPVGLISVHGRLRVIVLATVWIGAAAATVSKLCWVGAPKWLSAVVGIALGWVGVIVMPQLAEREGIAPIVLLAAGGVAYTAGAVVYALRRPDPVPAVFGYHELFHALTIVALVCQYVAVAFFIVRVA